MSETIIVLFSLKSGVDAAAYEAWAQSTDLPIVRGLGSVEQFEVLRTNGLLGDEMTAPFAYVEILRISSFEAFMEDVSTDEMTSVAEQFQDFADNPIFIRTKNLGAG